MIVVIKPGVEVCLHFLQRIVDFLPEGNGIELILNSPVKSLANSVGLRASGFGLAVINVLQGLIKLVFMVLPSAAVFRSSVGQNSQQLNTIFFVEGYYTVIKHIGCYKSIFAVIQLGESNLGISVYKSLLVDPADSFDGTYVVGVLRSQVTWMMRFDLSVCCFFPLWLVPRQ